MIRAFALSLVALCLVQPLGAIENEPPAPEAPEIAPASQEAERAIASFQIPEPLQASVFAAEPLVANIVAFSFDEKGRAYVCETFRQQRGVEDNRGHAHWLDEDLAAQTVEDRIAYIKRHLGEKALDYTKHDDRIRLVEDTNGDGRADRSEIFADRFNNIEDGTGAGVLAYQGNVYYTCIPKLWLLRDGDGDGRAEVRKALHDGYGVRFAFRGHDMHGLCLGPDGRLYFSIGDRGLNVAADDGRRLVNPESGAVLRCELDGSNLEMFATGLRNPQELAFDDHGNLFTGDNNSDSGDKARWVYVVEGGDSGWRMAYQYLSDRGPFNRERLWHPFHQGQAAYIVPPVANLADGPSGLAYYPGTGMGDALRGHFFLCDFRGTPSRSGVRAFTVKPRGAFFELADDREFLWSILATDVDFGPDGAMYVSDWVDGWVGLGKGRIYRFADPAAADDPVVREVQRLLAAGMAEHGADRLGAFLAHPDRRVRMEAQMELARRRETAALAAAAKEGETLLARLHGLWGLGQIARQHKDDAALAAVRSRLEDGDAEVRGHAAQLVGDARDQRSFGRLVELLKDDSARVRGFAALSLGKLGRSEAAPALAAMLAENADSDPIVRHFGIMGLAGAATDEQLVESAGHASSAVRLAAVVALRRHGAAAVAKFLDDRDELVALEAARAIHDAPILDAMPALAARIQQSSLSDPLARRVLNANFRLGGAEHAQSLASYAARKEAPEAMRLEAISMLADWASPSSRDRVLGMWRPLASRSAAPAQEALHKALPELLAASPALRAAAAQAAAELRVPEAGAALNAIAADVAMPADARAAALRRLGSLQDMQSAAAAIAAMRDRDSQVRAAALEALSVLKPQEAVGALRRAVEQGEPAERQAALTALGKMNSAAAAEAIAQALELLLAGKLPAEAHLEALEAARAKRGPAIAERLRRYERSAAADDPLAAHRMTLAGGNAERGAAIFFEKTEVSCVRCHKVDGRGGEVGPELSKIGADKTREYLLESIVAPNKVIAKDFETLVVVTADGQVHSGIVKEQTDEIVRLMTPEAKLLEIAKEDIEEQAAGKSAMPEDVMKHLSLRELRDLVEFLARQRGAE